MVKKIEKIVPKPMPIKQQKPVQKSRVEEIDEVEEKSPCVEEFEEEEDEIVQSKKNSGQKTSFVGFVKLPAVKVQAGFQEEEEESPIRQRLGSVKRRPVGFAASNRSLSSVSSIKQSAA